MCTWQQSIKNRESERETVRYNIYNNSAPAKKLKNMIVKS